MFTKLPKSTLMWRASIVSFIPRFGNASITKAALRPKTRKEDISLEGRAKCQIKGPKLQRTKARWEPKEWKPSAESQENSTSWSPCQGLLRLLWPDTKTTLSAYVKSALYINIYIYMLRLQYKNTCWIWMLVFCFVLHTELPAFFAFRFLLPALVKLMLVLRGKRFLCRSVYLQVFLSAWWRGFEHQAVVCNTCWSPICFGTWAWVPFTSDNIES